MTGIIIHYYGSPATLADGEAFYASIIHRQPTTEEVERLVNMYRAYGRPGPLGATVERLQRLLEGRLNVQDEERIVVKRAGKHSPPAVEDVVDELVAAGARRIVSLPLTPFGSRLGTDNYHRAVRVRLEETGAEDVTVIPVDRWYEDELFVQACAWRLDQAVQWLPDDVRRRSVVIFTTHSMPRKDASPGLSLAEQYERWATLTAKEAGVGTWRLSYRSAPGGDEHWLGPDVLDVIHNVAAEGHEAVIVCPLPTLVENVEVFEEAGTDAQSVARNLGVEFVRTELLNDAADMVDVLERLVVRALAQEA